MTVHHTREGCTVTTTYGKTTQQLGIMEPGTEIEHVTLECTRQVFLGIAKPDRIKIWDR